MRMAPFAGAGRGQQGFGAKKPEAPSPIPRALRTGCRGPRPDFAGMAAFRGRAGDGARCACRAFPGDPFILGCEEENNLKKPAVGFGLHLTLDGYECSYERLTNLDAIYEFLDTRPEMIHMTKITPP